jgi:hypothetical protein
MGGAQLTSDQVSAVAAYIWGLSHRPKSTPKPFHATAVAVGSS